MPASPSPLPDDPPRNPAGVVVRVPRWSRPAYLRPPQRPRVAAPRRLYAPPDANQTAGALILAGGLLGAILGGVAIGEGAAVNRYEPRIEAERATVLAVIHQARTAECQATAVMAGLGPQMREAMFGARFASWEPTLLTEAEVARCLPERQEEPLPVHWGSMEAP